MTEPAPFQEPPDHETGYERHDVHIRPILWFIFGLAAFILILMPILIGLFDGFSNRARRNDPALTPLIQRQQLPPPPRLQATPIQDYEDFRQQEEHILNSYAWIDRQQEIVRIPVERAMDLLAERGLPVPSGELSPQAKGQPADGNDKQTPDQQPTQQQQQPPEKDANR